MEGPTTQLAYKCLGLYLSPYPAALKIPVIISGKVS